MLCTFFELIERSINNDDNVDDDDVDDSNVWANMHTCHCWYNNDNIGK